MSGDEPKGKRKDGPRKVYKKIYRNKGEKMNGEPFKELTDEQKARQLNNLKYGRICMAFAMEGLPKPEKNNDEFSHVENDPVKGKTYIFKGYKNGKRINRHVRVGLNRERKKAKTTNYFYY